MLVLLSLLGEGNKSNQIFMSFRYSFTLIQFESVGLYSWTIWNGLSAFFMGRESMRSSSAWQLQSFISKGEEHANSVTSGSEGLGLEHRSCPAELCWVWNEVPEPVLQSNVGSRTGVSKSAPQSSVLSLDVTHHSCLYRPYSFFFFFS